MQTHTSVAVILAAAAFAFPLNASAQDGTLDTGFQGEANAAVRAIVVQTNGQLLIAGYFTSVNGFIRRVARLDADGELDVNFIPGSGPDGTVYAVALQTDGKVLIAGNFSTFNGIPAKRVARLNTNGSLDTNFNVGLGPDGEVFAVLFQRDGSIVIGGSFTSVNTSNRSRVARFNSDGSLDASFDTSPMDGVVQWTASDSDGGILIGGDFSSIGGSVRSGIARLKSDGRLDVNFYPTAGGHPVNAASDSTRWKGLDRWLARNIDWGRHYWNCAASFGREFGYQLRSGYGHERLRVLRGRSARRESSDRRTVHIHRWHGQDWHCPASC